MSLIDGGGATGAGRTGIAEVVEADWAGVSVWPNGVLTSLEMSAMSHTTTISVTVTNMVVEILENRLWDADCMVRMRCYYDFVLIIISLYIWLT
jgi:hypothetical protein